MSLIFYISQFPRVLYTHDVVQMAKAEAEAEAEAKAKAMRAFQTGDKDNREEEWGASQLYKAQQCWGKPRVLKEGIAEGWVLEDYF
jgi:hypothetical protein